MDIKGKRVLVVDDDSRSRRLFELQLGAMGFSSVLVNDGDEAMEILAGDCYFDLIITDVMMPYQTGFDLTKKLKEFKETKDIPVIATSAFHDWERERSNGELRVDGFVPKPVTKEALKKEIERILEGRP
ncbi:MAG: response regulator [Nitrospirae bacterium]|nr:response regulator [Nitrospirota bacterium]